jgi:hypothetical protein
MVLGQQAGQRDGFHVRPKRFTPQFDATVELDILMHHRHSGDEPPNWGDASCRHMTSTDRARKSARQVRLSSQPSIPANSDSI